MIHRPRPSKIVWLLSLLATLGPLLRASLHAEEPRFHVYVASGGTKEILVQQLNPATGELTEVQRQELSGGPGSLAVDPRQRFLHAAIRTTGSVTTLAIDPATGKLSPLATTPVASNPAYLATDRAGRHLLTAYYSADRAAVYPITPAGTVGAPATVDLATGKNPHSILADPQNRFVFVPNTGADRILQFRYDAATGTLTPNDPPQVMTPAGAGPRHFTFHPRLNTVYVVNEKNSTVTVYDLDANRGLLKARQTLPTLPKDFAGRNTTSDIHVTPDGRFVYSANRGHDSLAGFRVNERNGGLTAIGHFPTEAVPREFHICPDGRFVIAAGQNSDKLAVYRLDAKTGQLNRLHTYPAGKSPAWVTILKF